MRKVHFSVFPSYAHFQAPCLRISKVGAGAYFKILLLSGRPCFYITGFYFEVCQIAGAAFQLSYRDVETAEEFYGKSPHFFIPGHGIFRFADDNHFLLFKLVNSVDTSFFNTMGSLFFSEAGRIAGKRLRKGFLRNNLVDKLTNHGVLGGADQIEILPFNFIHHGFHICLAHDTFYNISMNHKRRNAIRKALVDHKIAGIGQNC